MELRQETEQKIMRLVSSGRFQNPDEVVEVALKSLDFDEDRPSESKARLEELMSEALKQPARPITEDDWMELNRRVKERGR